MTDELKNRMARLARSRLGSTVRRTRLPSWWRMVETFLVDELHIGISAETSEFNSWPAGKDEDGNSRTVYQTLAFGRVGAAFRIHVVDEMRIVDDEGGFQGLVSREQTPLPSCGRETKLRAVEKLPELLDMIIQETERLAETADETTSKIGAMIGDTTVTVPAPEVAPQFTTCPWCCEKGQWLNVGSRHWGSVRRLRGQMAHRRKPAAVVAR